MLSTDVNDKKESNPGGRPLLGYSEWPTKRHRGRYKSKKKNIASEGAIVRIDDSVPHGSLQSTGLNPNATSFKPTGVTRQQILSSTVGCPEANTRGKTSKLNNRRGRHVKQTYQTENNSGKLDSTATVDHNDNTGKPLIHCSNAHICPICSNASEFVAVGICNHSICSICALRMRVKSNEKSCAMCKRRLVAMIVYSIGHTPMQCDRSGDCGRVGAVASGACEADELRTFQSFGIAFDEENGQQNGDDAVLQLSAIASFARRAPQVMKAEKSPSLEGARSVEYDVPAGLLFINCPQHAEKLRLMRSITCPLPQCSSASGMQNEVQGKVEGGGLINEGSGLSGHQRGVSRKVFASHAALLRHLRDAHKHGVGYRSGGHDGGTQSKQQMLQPLTMCQLCLDHRPLFSSEMCVFTKVQLADHMKGYSCSSGRGSVSRVAPGSPEDTHVTGHPPCGFCDTHFFDQAELYTHMQRRHFTCHLCPPERMFRYYRDAAAVRAHHLEDHFVCGTCAACAGPDADVAFGDATAFTQHMRQFHPQLQQPRSSASAVHRFRLGAEPATGGTHRLPWDQSMPDHLNHGRRGGGRGDAGVVRNVIELDMGSANPFSAAPASGDGYGRSRAGVHSLQGGAESPLIPAHMRVVGRVSGSGIFQPVAEEDMALQAMADELAAAQATAGASWCRGSRAAGDAATEFPSLPPAPAPSASASIACTTRAAEPHPLSVMHSSRKGSGPLAQRQAVEEAAAKKAEVAKQQQARRVERNLELAAALLGPDCGYEAADVSRTEMPLSATAVGATLRDRAFSARLTGPLLKISGGGWSEEDLLRPLYPPNMVAWARGHKSEAQKIERRLAFFLAGGGGVGPVGSGVVTANSVQLKPMPRSLRQLVHQWAALHLLNTFEFDREPQRYVSLVKRVDSYLPFTALTQAGALPSFLLPMPVKEWLPDAAWTVAAPFAASTSTLSDDWWKVECVRCAPVSAHSEAALIFLSLSPDALPRQPTGEVGTGVGAGTAGGVGGSGSAGSRAARGGRLFTGTIAEVVTHVLALLDSVRLWRAWSAGVAECVLGRNASTRARLACLPLPRVTKLVAAGPSAIGLMFENLLQARLALQLLIPCLLPAANVAPSPASTCSVTSVPPAAPSMLHHQAMESWIIGELGLDPRTATHAQGQGTGALGCHLSALRAGFFLHPAFVPASLATLFDIPSDNSTGGCGAGTSIPAMPAMGRLGGSGAPVCPEEGTHMPAAAVAAADLRHFYSPAPAPPLPVCTSSDLTTAAQDTEEEWQHMSVKTKVFVAEQDEGIDGAMRSSHMPLVVGTVLGDWEDCGFALHEASSGHPDVEEAAAAASGADDVNAAIGKQPGSWDGAAKLKEEDDEEEKEWQNFLQNKRRQAADRAQTIPPPIDGPPPPPPSLYEAKKSASVAPPPSKATLDSTTSSVPPNAPSVVVAMEPLTNRTAAASAGGSEGGDAGQQQEEVLLEAYMPSAAVGARVAGSSTPALAVPIPGHSAEGGGMVSGWNRGSSAASGWVAQGTRSGNIEVESVGMFGTRFHALADDGDDDNDDDDDDGDGDDDNDV